MSAAPLPRPEAQRRQGFTPLPNECLWDWSRLVSGDAQVMSILYINSELHPVREKGQPPPKWTRSITYEELAAFCRCTVRAVDYAFKDLVERKVIVRKKTAQGFAYAIPFETWPELPDRPPKVVSIADPEQAEEESEEEANKPRGQVLPVFSKPQKVRAGGRTRPKELPAAAGKLQFEAENEIEFDARMCDGILTIRAKGESEANKKGTKGEAKRNRLQVDCSQGTENTRLGNFHTFESVWLEHGINAAPDDWAASRVAWSRLDTAEQLAAVAGVRERFYLGEYDVKETKWIPLPQNYLQKKYWLRPIRGAKANAPKVFKDEATVKAAHEMAQARDRALARKGIK
jgi:hypothetical protein